MADDSIDRTATQTPEPPAPEPPARDRRSARFLFTGEGWPYLLVPLIPVAVVLELVHAAPTWVFLASALGVIPTAMPRIAELTAPFLARHPAAEVTILSRSSDEIRDQIAALELDAGVTYLDGEHLGRLRTIPLFLETLCLVDRTEEGGPVSWAEAARRPLCLLTPDMQNRRIVAARLAEADAPAVPLVESNSMLAILSHVAAGGWAAILPQALADGLPLPPGVRARPLSGGPGNMVGLVLAAREPLPPLLEAMVQVTGHAFDR